jgi:hypothetical protein
MNSIIKEKWLTALRSGKFKQGKEELRTLEDKFCCLGVLCDIYRKETKLGKWGKNRFNKFHFTNTKKNNQKFEDQGVLPLSVKQWAELPDCNPSIDGLHTLATLNDNGSTFQEIADIIEKNF